MQKKKTLMKKNTPVEQTKNNAQSNKKKDFSKPLSFFAVFVLCIAAAMLFPYLTQEQPINVPVKTQQVNKNLTQEEPAFIKEIEETEIQPVTEQPDYSDKDQTIAEQKKTIEDLKEKIHQLELNNLNLKEQASSCEKSATLAIQLLDKIYTGKPFDSTLKQLLKHDQTDAFALAIQENLGQYAQIGIMTPEKLKQLFNAQKKITLDSFYACKPDASWNQKWTNFFKSLVHVYPENPSLEDKKPENILFLAEKQVNAGQFESALLTIEKLPDSSKHFLTNFVQNATRYIKAQKVIKTYTQERN